jgi:hypothetical protein
MGMSSRGLDSARLRTIVASDRYLALPECAKRAGLAAALIELGRVERSGAGEAVLLWRDEHFEAWLNVVAAADGWPVLSLVSAVLRWQDDAARHWRAVRRHGVGCRLVPVISGCYRTAC